MNQPQKHSKIILIGESCYDVYRAGSVERVSPEAPVPVFSWSGHETIHDGMASNVCKNFTNFGVDVDLYTDHVENKIRYYDEKSNYQMLRVDQPLNHMKFQAKLIDDWNADAIVISDYDKGFISYGDIKQLRMRFSGPMFLDTKKQDLAQFTGITLKINNDEWRRRTSDSSPNHTIITGGSGYVTWGDDHWLPKKIDMIDVCGAEDTFLAAFVTKYLQLPNGNVYRNSDSIKYAIGAASVTCKKVGVYAPTMEEVDETGWRS